MYFTPYIFYRVVYFYEIFIFNTLGRNPMKNRIVEIYCGNKDCKNYNDKLTLKWYGFKNVYCNQFYKFISIPRLQCEDCLWICNVEIKDE